MQSGTISKARTICSDAEMQIIQDPKVFHKVAGVRLRSKKSKVQYHPLGPMALVKNFW